MLITRTNSKYRLTPAVLLCMLWLTSPVLAADDIPRILVTGKGSVDVAPDMAVLSLTVSREADTARAALDANSAAMRDVLEAMRAEGVETRDLQTSNFSIQPRYFHPPPARSGEREPPRIVGYTVRNSLMVRVRDISALGAILDKSVTLGVNEGGNIRFANADPSVVLEQARVMAVQQAVARAHTLATAAGVTAGKILEISEQARNPQPMRAARSEVMMADAAGSVPVASGENTYSVTVHIKVAIEQ